MKYLIPILLIILPKTFLGQNNIALIGSNSILGEKDALIEDKDVRTTKFEWFDRMIVVNATLNGKQGKYILDTGSPMLVVNQKPTKNSSSIGGIGQNEEAEIINIKEFSWAGISQKSFEAVSYDMSNLEHSLGFKIDGLIGQNIFDKYELYLDVSLQIIQLHPLRRSKLHQSKKYQQKISLSFEGHIPVIKVKIDGKNYRFGIDTGAEVNVLNKDLIGKLSPTLLKHKSESEIFGLDGKSQAVDSYELENFTLKNFSFPNYQFLSMDLSNLAEEFDLHLDGILGYPFLIDNTISINYKKQKLYIW